MGALLELADALLADPQVQADLPERPLGDAPDAVVVHDDPSLAAVQPAQESFDRGPAAVLGLILFVPLDLGVRRRERCVVGFEGPEARVPRLPVVARSSLRIDQYA